MLGAGIPIPCERDKLGSGISLKSERQGSAEDSGMVFRVSRIIPMEVDPELSPSQGLFLLNTDSRAEDRG